MASMTRSQYVIHCLVSTDLTKIKPFMTHFPCIDIYEMLLADILHQLVKGTFKEHLVHWIGEYLHLMHRESGVKNILDDIDHQ